MEKEIVVCLGSSTTAAKGTYNWIRNLKKDPGIKNLHEQMLNSPGKTFTTFSSLSFYKDYLFREFILRKNFDEISEMNGWKFHIDEMHLNTAAGMILTNLIQSISRNKRF